MSELRAVKPSRARSRGRSAQGRLSIQFGDEETAGDHMKVQPTARNAGFRRPAESMRAGPQSDRAIPVKTPAPVFHPLAYRSVVADWTLDWRERWGLRANELEEAGLSWRDAEAQAFAEVWHQIRREGNDG